MTGKLISFEGIDGAGKTTVIEYVQQYLLRHHRSVFVAREPGTTPIGQQIRELLKSSLTRTPITELLLHEASRSSTVEFCIRPSLAQYDFVLLDRYVDSTIAYQGYGNQLSIPMIEQLNKIATADLMPDARFLIDVSVSEAQKRRQQRLQTVDSHDILDDDLEYAKRVYQGYQELVKQGILIDMPNYNSNTTAKLIGEQLLKL